MGTEKRQRQKEGRAKRREADQKAALRARRKTQGIRLAVLFVVVTLGVFAIATFGKDDKAKTKGKAKGIDTTTTTVGAPGTGAKAVPAFAYGTGECGPADKPSKPVRVFTAAPKKCIEDGRDYGAVIDTSKGEIAVDLDESLAPGTVNNFVTLARYGYYDGDDFHRVVKDFVIQGGDPVGDPPGTGGPGYTIDDELPTKDNPYVEGSLAMANSGPNTNGSQFFIYVGPNELGPNYSLFGKVTKGIEVVKAIEALSKGDGPPSEPVTIKSVTITES